MSVDFTILHNPRCSTSRAAMEALDESGKSYDVVQYLKQPLDTEQLRALVALFKDNPSELVRRDANFTKLGLSEEQVRTSDQVVAILAEHPELLQRPILIRHSPDGEQAIIGRPKQMVPDFLR